MTRRTMVITCDLSIVMEYFNLVVNGESTPFGSGGAKETHSYLRDIVEGLGTLTIQELRNLAYDAICTAITMGVNHDKIPIHQNFSGWNQGQNGEYAETFVETFTDRLITMVYNEFGRQIPEVEKMQKYRVRKAHWGSYTLEVTYFE